MSLTPTQRPLLLTGPYLAMWLWLIVPLTIHGLMPVGVLPKWSVNLHMGAWMEEIGAADNIGDAWRIMRQDRRYSLCRYVRFDRERASLVALPPNDQHCSFLRLTRPGKGHVVRSASYAQIINSLRNN